MHGLSFYRYTSRRCRIAYNVGVPFTFSCQEVFNEKQKRYFLFHHAFTGCDIFNCRSALSCAEDIDEYLDIFLDLHTTKYMVIRSGIAIFKTFTMYQVI